VDFEETDEAYVVEAELPGVKPGDVDVELHDHELAIHGEVKERERTGVLRHTTRRTGQFDYRVSLPGKVDAEKVDASVVVGPARVPSGAAGHGSGHSRDRDGRRGLPSPGGPVYPRTPRT
jgi:HSP20 family protein